MMAHLFILHLIVNDQDNPVEDFDPESIKMQKEDWKKKDIPLTPFFMNTSFYLRMLK